MIKQFVSSLWTRENLIGLAQFLVVVVVVFAAILFSREDRTVSRTEDASADNNTPLVNVLRPAVERGQVKIRTTGSVVTRSRVTLVPQISGRAVEVAPTLRTGGRFSANEVLLRIDPRDFDLAVAQARADLSGARANLQLEQAKSSAAIENYALLNGKAVVPPLVARKPQLQQAEAQVRSAETRLSSAQLNRERCAFSLPFAGAIASASVEVGQLIAPATSFGTAFSLDAVEITVPITTAQLASIQPAIGRQVRIFHGSQVAAGQVERVSADVDERTRFARLFVKPRQPDQLPPGTFVEVELQGPAVPQSLRIPIASEQTGGNLWVVRGGRLDTITPQVLERGRDYLTVVAFDFGTGIVIGQPAEAAPGILVSVVPEAHGS